MVRKEDVLQNIWDAWVDALLSESLLTPAYGHWRLSPADVYALMDRSISRETAANLAEMLYNVGVDTRIDLARTAVMRRDRIVLAFNMLSGFAEAHRPSPDLLITNIGKTHPGVTKDSITEQAKAYCWKLRTGKRSSVAAIRLDGTPIREVTELDITHLFRKSTPFKLSDVLCDANGDRKIITVYPFSEAYGCVYEGDAVRIFGNKKVFSSPPTMVHNNVISAYISDVADPGRNLVFVVDGHAHTKAGRKLLQKINSADVDQFELLISSRGMYVNVKKRKGRGVEITPYNEAKTLHVVHKAMTSTLPPGTADASFRETESAARSVVSEVVTRQQGPIRLSNQAIEHEKAVALLVANKEKEVLKRLKKHLYLATSKVAMLFDAMGHRSWLFKQDRQSLDVYGTLSQAAHSLVARADLYPESSEDN